MAGRLPSKAELHQQAENGILFTPQQVADIAQKESEYNGPGITAGGPAATAQSFYDKQQNFLHMADEMMEKPSASITKQDAAEIQSLESKALGGVRPAKGSFSATIQSIADHNQAEVGGDNKEAGAYITKEDASKAQHGEAVSHGGNVAKGSVAAQLQSIADKTAQLKDNLSENLVREAKGD
ncbi:hypothetical protein ABW19_dt0201830 [Dactylella cylindrospora]|nr:hypothetical protein ABW19_dt0201830 [Dactylella cylindrospora]